MLQSVSPTRFQGFFILFYFFVPSKGHESGLLPNWGHPFTHKWCRQSLGRKLAWSPHLEQLCVWQTFGLLTTHRQGPSCSTGVCQLGTQMGLWESQSSVYQSLDVTPLSQTSMPPLSLRTIFAEMSFLEWWTLSGGLPQRSWSHSRI